MANSRAPAIQQFATLNAVTSDTDGLPPSAFNISASSSTLRWADQSVWTPSLPPNTATTASESVNCGPEVILPNFWSLVRHQIRTCIGTLLILVLQLTLGLVNAFEVRLPFAWVYPLLYIVLAILALVWVYVSSVFWVRRVLRLTGDALSQSISDEMSTVQLRVRVNGGRMDASVRRLLRERAPQDPLDLPQEKMKIWGQSRDGYIVVDTTGTLALLPPSALPFLVSRLKISTAAAAAATTTTTAVCTLHTVDCAHGVNCTRFAAHSAYYTRCILLIAHSVLCTWHALCILASKAIKGCQRAIKSRLGWFGNRTFTSPPKNGNFGPFWTVSGTLSWTVSGPRPQIFNPTCLFLQPLSFNSPKFFEVKNGA